MTQSSLAFVSTCFYCYRGVRIRSASFFSDACITAKRYRPPQSESVRPAQISTLYMRRSREGYRSAKQTVPPLRKVVDRALSLWQNASPNEKLAISAAIAAAVSLAGFAVNLLFHVSLILSFSIIPLLLAPILLAVIASLTAFAFFTMMTAGAGIFFIGTPFVAIALLAKSLFAILVIVGGVSGIVASVLGIKSEKEESEAVVFDVEEEDEFERFDKRLRRRSVGREKGWDVSSWGMSEVIDELGFTGLGEYRQLFIEERIDGRTLLELTDDDIRSEFAAAMPLGDRMRLGRLVSELRKRASRLP